MDNPFDDEMAATESVTACFYKADQALWVDDRWKCPHCSGLNNEADGVCHCGFDRGGLADFHNRRTFSVAKLVMVLAL